MKRSSVSFEFEVYWMKCREGNPLPERKDFDTLGLGELIPNFFELYIKDATQLSSQIHFAGGGLVDIANIEVTDTDFFDYFSEENRPHAMRRMKALADYPCGLCQNNIVSLGADTDMTIEMTGFPVASADHDIAIFGTAIPIEDNAVAREGKISLLSAAQDLLWIDVGFGVPDTDLS